MSEDNNSSYNFYNVLLDISAFSDQKVEELQNFLVGKGIEKDSILQFVPGRNRYNDSSYSDYTTAMVVPFEKENLDLEPIAECIRQYYEIALGEIKNNATEGIKPDAHLVVNTSFSCQNVFKKDGPEAFGLFMRGCSSHQRNESLSGIMYPVQKLLYYRKENMIQINQGENNIKSAQPMLHESDDKYVGIIDDLFVDPRKGVDELIWKIDGYIKRDNKYIPKLSIESKYRHYRNRTFDYDQMEKVLWNGRRSRGIVIPENGLPEVIQKSVHTEHGVLCSDPSLANFLSKRVENNVRQRVIRFPANKRLTEEDRRELEERRKNFRLKTFNDKTTRFINGFYLYKKPTEQRQKTSKKHDNEGIDYLKESSLPVEDTAEEQVVVPEAVESNHVTNTSFSEEVEATPTWEPVGDSSEDDETTNNASDDNSDSSPDNESSDDVDFVGNQSNDETDESEPTSVNEQDDEDESSFEPHDEGEDPHGAEAMQEEFDQDDA